MNTFSTFAFHSDFPIKPPFFLCRVPLFPHSLTWLFTRLGQSISGHFVRQEVEAVARYVPQGQSRPSSEEASESVLLQDDGHAVNRPPVALCRPLALQPHLHQVYGCTDGHLRAGSGYRLVELQ